MITVTPYDNSFAAEWNDFVCRSKNGTFLFDRNFMEYHADRFEDVSLMFHNDKGETCGIFPANHVSTANTVISHSGLTYGGLIIDNRAVQTTVNKMISLAARYYADKLEAKKLVYKPTPYIYHRIPSQEDLYTLTTLGATLSARAVSSALVATNHPPFRKGRKACISKARRIGITVERIASGDTATISNFHEALSTSLSTRHNAKPVHSLAEMTLLMRRFPDNIRLYTAMHGSKVFAGAWLFVTPAAIHTQYLVNTEEGRSTGAEDILIDFLITHESNNIPFFDFGISTERNGTYLNENLISMKEGFGARSVCYDTYTLPLSNNIKLSDQTKI